MSFTSDCWVWHDIYGKLRVEYVSPSGKTLECKTPEGVSRSASADRCILFEEYERNRLEEQNQLEEQNRLEEQQRLVREENKRRKKKERLETARQARLTLRQEQELAGLPVFLIHDEFIGNPFDPTRDVNATTAILEYCVKHAKILVYASPQKEQKAISMLIRRTGWSEAECKPYIHVGQGRDGKTKQAHDIKIDVVLPNSSFLTGLDERLQVNFGYSDWCAVPSERSIGELQINKSSFGEWLIEATAGELLHNFEEEPESGIKEI